MSRVAPIPALVVVLVVALPASADLSGSRVEYDCGNCYLEWTSSTLCFEAVTMTTDGAKNALVRAVSFSLSGAHSLCKPSPKLLEFKTLFEKVKHNL